MRPPRLIPRSRRMLAATVLLLALAGPLAPAARAAGNASSAAGFIEDAQNPDGGFAENHGGPSQPAASLWATVALLAAGKNPVDERLNGGSSASDYLAAHLAGLHSLTDLGLLAVVQAASGAVPGRYGDPGAKLRSGLTASAIRSDPGGAALGIIGLIALRDTGAAATAAQGLPGAELADGGWGPKGTSDSASTALVLEAIAQAGQASAQATSVQRGIAYLQRAQVNDGSIAISDRTDVSSSGDVASTAFTIQALAALHHPTLRTSTGTSVLAGLASYQQLSSGGLSPFGAYDTGVAPSVTQTAQAYPAFDGIALPLPYVAPQPPPAKTAPASKASGRHTPARAANRESAGTTATGVSSSAPSTKRRVGAYQGATANGSAKGKAARHRAPAGTQVTGSVVGATAPPKLTTRAGRPPGKDLSALYLALLLAAVAVTGAALDWRRPRRDSRPALAVVLQAIVDFLGAAWRRRVLAPAAIALLGAALVVLPAATGMWTRAPAGARMIEAFAPYMRSARLSRLDGDVKVIDAAVREALASGPRLQFGAAPGARRRFAADDAGIVTFASQWRGIHRRFSGLLDPMRANQGNFEALAGLPSFTLFPWFLVVPGALLLVLGATAIAVPRWWRRLRWAVLALGAALILAPLALGLFAAAPRGAHLVASFQTIETRATATALQDDFSTLVVGESDLASELPARAVARLPAVSRLSHRWIAILGDFTPVLGVLNDSLATYRAVAALPDFTLFPWLFAVPGLLALAVVLGAAGPMRALPRRLRALDPHPYRSSA